MAYSLGAIQIALIALYRSDITLRGLMSPATGPDWGIYDQGGNGRSVPLFPLLVVRPIFARTGSVISFGKDAIDVFVQVDTFTNEIGYAHARTIAGRAYNLLEGPVAGPLAIAGGFINCLTLLDNHQELEEVHGTLVQHIADRYKLWVQG